MSRSPRLSPTEHDFFALVAQAAFANPFSAERERLDRAIAGVDAGIRRSELFARVVKQVDAALCSLDAGRRADLRHYQGTERDIMRTVYLFDVYHRFCFPFDDLIIRQHQTGDTPLPVPFAREVGTALAAQGFNETEIPRYLAIFYQIRRAFYFIETSLSGRSSSMHTLRRHLWNNVFTTDITRYETMLWNRMEDFSTLLLGETGTGKGAAAAAIGRSGYIPFDERKGCFAESFTRNFISLNLSQYPEALIESELFGHKKGAFTGAIGDHAGVFSRCTPHGSIFLDEIGDLSIPVQIKLLQVLQERTFTPVGSHERQRFHGRVIAATHKPLDSMRRNGQFRDDFYYRLCSDIVLVPSLRQRLQEEPGELAILVDSILHRLIGTDDTTLGPLVCDTLERDLPPGYPWPGNVRELEQAVRRILVAGHYRTESSTAAPTLHEQLLEGIANGTLDARTLLGGYCRHLYQRLGTCEAVAKRLNLDRRTVKKYLAS